MRFHLLPNRHRLGVGATLIQQRDVGWWRRRRCTEDVVEQPAAAQHRRRAVWVRRDGQDAALTEQSTPNAVGEGDAPEVAAIHVRDPVVASEPLVHERVVGGDQIHDAAILAQLRSNEQSRFLAERVAEVLVELRMRIDVWHDAGELADGQPLTREVVYERLRAAIGEHPAHLPFQRRTIAERALGGYGEELVIRNAAPEEEGQSRCEVELAHAIRLARGRRWLALDAEQKPR